jgi:hypothetical protein
MPIPQKPGPCPECGETDRYSQNVRGLELAEQEPANPYQRKRTRALKALVCTGCGHVSLFVAE